MTVGVSVVAPEAMLPPLEAVQRYAKLVPVEPVPCKITVAWVQVIAAAGPALAVGSAVLPVTIVFATLEQVLFMLVMLMIERWLLIQEAWISRLALINNR